MWLDESLTSSLDRSKSIVTRLPQPDFGHLRALTDRLGVWEHAAFSNPRQDHGFCTDDNARALVVVNRQAAISGGLTDLAATYLGFVLEARTPEGFHNRRDLRGAWTDTVGGDDCQGRAWWGLGTAYSLSPESWMRDAAAGAWRECGFSSPHLRANAYAALGAADVMESTKPTDIARRVLDATTATIVAAARSNIPWPERRLSYDNARLPEALIAGGSALDDNKRLSLGLRLLEWLVDVETNEGHFSFAPAGGVELAGQRPGFDQQPLECWAMADACYRAWIVTGMSLWREHALNAVGWLLGLNDTGAVLYDHVTGGTADGLMSEGINENYGAESTIAGLGALQVAAKLG